MTHTYRVAPFSLRIDEQLKTKAREEAVAHRRSLNTELELLIEEGFKWREIQNKQAIA